MKKLQQQFIKCRMKLASVWVYKKKIWSMDSRKKGFLYGSYKHWVHFNIFCKKVWFSAPGLLFSSKSSHITASSRSWKLRRTRFYYFLHTTFTREWKKKLILNEHKSHCVLASLAKQDDYRCTVSVVSSFRWRQSFHMMPNTICLGSWLLFLSTSRKQISNNFLCIHRSINNVYSLSHTSHQ